MKKIERVTRRTPLKKEGDMKKSRAVRSVVLVVIVCLAGLLQPGSVVLSHGWTGKADEAKLTMSSTGPDLQASVVEKSFVAKFYDDVLTHDWVPVSPTWQHPLGSESDIVDTEFDSYYKWEGYYKAPLGNPRVYLEGREKAEITFERTYVSKLRVKLLMQVFADKFAEWEYWIKAYDRGTQQWEYTGGTHSESDPTSSCLVLDIRDTFDVDKYIDKVVVYVRGMGQEWGKDWLTQGFNDVKIVIYFYEVQPAFEFLQADEYRWSNKYCGYDWKWDPYPHVFEGCLQVRIENKGNRDAYNVTATITDWPVNTEVPDPDVTVGDIPVWRSKWSEDTFTVRVDMRHPVDPCEGIFWRIEYYDADGGKHVMKKVPEFPLGEGPCD